MKYVLVSGGVISGIGKGVIGRSTPKIGELLILNYTELFGCEQLLQPVYS